MFNETTAQVGKLGLLQFIHTDSSGNLVVASAAWRIALFAMIAAVVFLSRHGHKIAGDDRNMRESGARDALLMAGSEA